MAPFLLPEALPAIRQRYPALELLLVERLQQGELDTAVLAFPYPVAPLAAEDRRHRRFSGG